MARIIGKAYSYDDVSMVTRYNRVPSRKDVSLKTRVTRNYSLDMPLIAANMDTICESKMAIAIGRLGGLGVIHRFLPIEKQARDVQRVRDAGLIAAAAIGVRDYEQRVPALVDAGVNILVLDIAHGHSKYAGKALDWIKQQNYSMVDVMAGNIVTKDAAHYFLTKDADAVKVGIGPGSMCTTRIMTGVGVPQVTAIMDVYEETQGRIPICADGGIRIPGDCVKAIGAGASSMMAGGIFSGCLETPGNIVTRGREKFKVYRGMASYDATIKKLRMDGKKENEVISVEGEKKYVKFKGSIEPIIQKFLGGIVSGMTYNGARTIDELVGKADFVEISSAGIEESRAHGLDVD